MLKKTIFPFLFLFLCSVYSQESYFLLDPTVSPNAETIVFSYDSDLWKVSTKGGTAVRLTAMEGEETLARISPDGKWLAFTGTQYGNRDIYLMPMAGGPIKQLTFHDTSDELDSWSWDSKSVYFTSSRSNRYSGYQLSIEGGTPQSLFPHYFNTTHNIAEHPNSGELFFNESWESKNFAHRKRYKGAYNPNIKSYDPSTKTYKEYTHYTGKDMWASLDQQGQLYFVSDEGNDEYNLYTFLGTEKKALTSFNTSIGRPQVSANGAMVVFTKDYQIYSYDTTTKTTQKVAIAISQNNTLAKTKDFKTSGEISHFDVASDTKKIAFVSRGVLFVSDIKGTFIKEMPTKSGERVTEAYWLPDNKTLLYTRTNKGYTNIFTIVADGGSSEKQHTQDLRNNVNLELDAQKKKAVYISGRDELRLLDLTTLKSSVLIKDEFWAIYAPQPHFSPDGSYITYNAIRNFEADTFVIRLSDKKATNLTRTGVTEEQASWSPDGKYLYFRSNLVKPSYPYGLPDAKIYRMALDKYENPYKSEGYDNLFKTEKTVDSKDKKSKNKQTISNNTTPIQINPVNSMERVQRIGPNFGGQSDPNAIAVGKAHHVLYLSDQDQGKAKLWKTVMEPYKANQIKKVFDTEIQDYQLVSAGDAHYLLLNGDIYTFNVEKNTTQKIAITHTFRRNLLDEFTQMFYEAWAGFEENFYDGNFHGQDWTALQKRYANYLPYMTKRSQLRLLFNDMLGELNTSHFGFSSSGKEETAFYGTTTLATGIVFSNENPFRVERIITDGPADVRGKNIQKGDMLVSVNGIAINAKINREYYFNKPSLDQEIKLGFKRSGNLVSVNIHPIRSGTQRNLFYDEWMDANQAYIDKKSDKKIAYIHMKNMTGGELQRFKREMVSETSHRDALILDLRYNTGGNVHDEVLQMLSQKPYLKWKYRDGQLAPQPNFGPAAKPIVVLINEQSLSDAEVTTAGFKALGLGTVIGIESYRWIIFTSGKGLVDGSFYRLPSWGCYTLDGKNLEKEGVAPDITVNQNFKDRLEGKEPQLDRALEEILKQL